MSSPSDDSPPNGASSGLRPRRRTGGKPSGKPAGKPGGKPSGKQGDRTGPRPQAQGDLPRNILWLASYPKSGNTWTRIFLANYLFARETPMPINEVHRLGLGDSIRKTYAQVAARRTPGADPDLDDPQASLALRPAVLKGIVANRADVNLVKTHNARSSAFGTDLIPERLTRGAVYILRDPRDVALSYARHYGLTHAETVARMASPDNVVAADGGSVTQFLGNWSAHVAGWTEGAPFPVLTLRYEDLAADPETAFARLLEHLGLTPEPERLARAIRFSAFEEVSRQEQAQGFIERSARSARFFHAGTAGQWQRDLAPDLARRLAEAHGPLMRRHGYLDRED